MKYIYGIWALFLLSTINVAAQAPAQTVPAFTFKKLNEATFSTRDLCNGKLLFFVFFDADCDHCQRSIQYIGQHYQEFKALAIYLISLDSMEKIKWFINKYGYNLKDKKNVTILRDIRNEFIQKFGPRKYPSLFLYSEKRELMLYEDNEQNLYRFERLINNPGRKR
jgi:peroxiredoxin